MEDISTWIAVISTDGKQWKVSKGSTLVLDQRLAKEGSMLTFDKVLLLHKNKQTQIGNPYIQGTSITAKIGATFKGNKVVIFKKKRRKGYKVKRGYRKIHT